MNDLIAEARAGFPGERVRGSAGDLVRRLADALESAEARATEAEAEMHARELHHFEVEQDLAAERAGREVERQMLGNVPVLVAGLEAERDAALAVIEEARMITRMATGWRFRDIRRILSSVPADVLRERDAEKWDEGWDASGEGWNGEYLPPGLAAPNPYRTEQNSEGNET